MLVNGDVMMVIMQKMVNVSEIRNLVILQMDKENKNM